MKKKKEKGTRKGYTTGACSAAAARAAVLGLITGKVPETVECLLPNGEKVNFNVSNVYCDNNTAHAVVIKDAGDDPDCTDKAPLTADVCFNHEKKYINNVTLKGGVGVGRITMKGLGLEVGGLAINPVPKKNIEDNIRIVATDALKTAGIDVTISVPGGIEMSKKTLNYRLGILDGISILGTTGIVHPYSTSAFRASVIQGIEVAANQGQDTVVLTTGGRTEKFVMHEMPELDDACFVQMGDFLRYALDTVVSEKIKHAIIGGMVGKLTKMAQGETITHAGRNKVNTTLLAELASSVGATKDVCNDIAASEMARYAAERMEELGLLNEFYNALANKVIETLSERYPNKFKLTVLVCDFDGNKLAHVSGNNQGIQ